MASPIQHRPGDAPAPISNTTGSRLVWNGAGWYGLQHKGITSANSEKVIVFYGGNQALKPTNLGNDELYWCDSRNEAESIFVKEGGGVRRKRSQSKRRRSRSRSRKNGRGKK
jgi:hypothetical protein